MTKNTQLLKTLIESPGLWAFLGALTGAFTGLATTTLKHFLEVYSERNTRREATRKRVVDDYAKVIKLAYDLEESINKNDTVRQVSDSPNWSEIRRDHSVEAQLRIIQAIYSQIRQEIEDVIQSYRCVVSSQKPGSDTNYSKCRMDFFKCRDNPEEKITNTIGSYY